MERLLQMSGGFMEAKVLLAGAELKVFDCLKDRGSTAAEVALGIQGDPRGVEILMDALVSIGILRKEGNIYRNQAEFEPYLVDGGRDWFLGALRHRNRVFRNWAFLEERVLGQPLPEVLTARGLLTDAQTNENFIEAMYAMGKRNAPAVADAIDLADVRTVADLGGGPGHYLAEFARRLPDCQPYLLDLPLTLAVARRIQSSSPLFACLHFVEWDFYNQPAPPGLPAFDLVFVSAVLHAESPERNTNLLRRLFPLVSPNGRVVVQENMVEEGRTAPMEAALFAINMLAGTAGGRTYTAGEIASWGESAGFVAGAPRRLNPRSCLISLTRPAR